MLASSFGPFGRSILLYNETILLLTRDAQQILNQQIPNKSPLQPTATVTATVPPLQSSSESSLSYDAYLFKVLLKYNTQSSDGLCTLSMLLQCFLSLVSSTTGSHIHSLELLHAMELIMAVMHSNETEITKLMIVTEVWMVENDIRKFLSNMFRVILAPALNISTANKISGIVRIHFCKAQNDIIACMYVCMYVYTYLHLDMYVYICIYVKNVCMYCMYVRIYVI